MVKPFTDAVAKMKIGSYSTKPVKTQYGWHVILLQDTRAVAIPDLDQVREQITQYLKSQKVGEYIRKLSKKSKVKILTEK